VGWLREEAEALGTSFDDRGARLDEWILAMRALWSQPVASFPGEYVRFDGVKCEPHPANPTGIPILIGGHSLAAARRAGRLGDGFLPQHGGRPGGLEEIARLQRIAEESARAAGRDASALELTSIGAPEPETAKAFANTGISRMIGVANWLDTGGRREGDADPLGAPGDAAAEPHVRVIDIRDPG